MHQGLHRVLEIIPKAPGTFALRLERCGLVFLAGQCVNIGIPRSGINREYSTYSGEQETELRFLIREVEGGQLTPCLARLQPGDAVEIDGAYGLFTLPQERQAGQKFVFIATGTGIAPFHSFVQSYRGLDYRILHGIRTLEEAYDRSDYDAQSYVACVSQGPGGDYRGRVTDYLRSHRIEQDAIYYLCGNRNMINEVYDILRDSKVSSSQIFTEVFF